LIPLEAKLLQSFGNLSFGSTTKEAEKFFGPCEETEELDGIDGSNSLVWHYWAKGFSLFFDRERGDKFSSVEVDSSVHLILHEIQVFKLNEIELKDLLSKKGYKDLDEEHHEWGEKRVTFDDAMADFYFENGILVSVNFGTTFSGESENKN
jgi:hypothetical protein